jgi:hypothetical protein
MHYQRLRKHGTLDGPPSVYDRVMAKTVIQSAPYPGLSPCIIFTGYLNERGYGKVTTVIDGVPRTLRAHRVVAERHLGTPPPGAQVQHLCDVRHCVNWKHLRYGTAHSNQVDRMTKGRFRRQVHVPNVAT